MYKGESDGRGSGVVTSSEAAPIWKLPVVASSSGARRWMAEGEPAWRAVMRASWSTVSATERSKESQHPPRLREKQVFANAPPRPMLTKIAVSFIDLNELSSTVLLVDLDAGSVLTTTSQVE